MNGVHTFLILFPWLTLLLGLGLRPDRNGMFWGVAVRDFLILFIGYVSVRAACPFQAEHLISRFVTAQFTAIVLALSSREDLRTQSFYVLPLLASIATNLVTAFLSEGFRDVSSPFAVPMWKELLIVVVILTALRIGGLAIGDCGIYLACYLAFLTLCKENSFLAFFAMLLASTLLGILTWIFGMAFKGKTKERFPFTTQIALGYVSAVLVFCYVPLAMSGGR